MEDCDELGLVGPAARACGAARDVRRDHPYGLYRFAHIPVVTADSGDVFARAWVRKGLHTTPTPQPAVAE